jgi:4-oxalmesaconate hydratase
VIIDCHGHYTTAPPALREFRRRLLEPGADLTALDAAGVAISDDAIRDSLESAQLRLQRERGTDLTIFSPQASGMAHHEGGAAVGAAWSRQCNDLIARVCQLYPSNFAPVCQLPQSPGVEPGSCVPELRRCVEELGFVGCNLNPDPSGGHWSDPPLTDPWWYPLYEAMVELDVPAMIHVSASCNPNFHTTGGHYLAADTTAFMQLLLSDIFERFPNLRFVIPHGGGAVPYHWGRYRGIAQDLGRPPLAQGMLGNVFFDTCVYHYPGIRLLAEVIPTDNILFASEMVGAVRGIDPETGHNYDDTRRYVDQLADVSDEQRQDIYAGNTLRVYPRLAVAVGARTAADGAGA